MLPLKTEYVLNVVLLVRPGASNGFSNKADGSLCRLQEQNILPVRCPSFIQQTLRWSSLPLVISCSVCCSTHALQCSWISMTAWWQHVCICQECSNYIIGGTLPRRLQFEDTAAFLDHHGSSVAAWLSLTGALHGYVYDRTIQEKDTRK